MKNIRETIKTIIREESEYRQFFRKALEKTGKSITDMSDEEKKAFFNKIDAAWDGKGEKNEGNAFGAAVVKAKEAGEDGFEVGGKTFKVESVNEKMDTMTKAQWNKTHKDYKSIRNGVHYVLKMTDSGTASVPVKIVEDVNEEQPGLWANIRAKRARGEKPAHKNSQSHKDAVKAGEKINKEEIVKEAKSSVSEEIQNWGTIQNVFVKFLQANTKELAKRVQVQDEEGTKNAIKSIISGLTNAQKSLKLESINENFSPVDIGKIKTAVESASSFMGIGAELKKLGMKYTFTTSPLPVYMIKKGSKTFVLVNEKYADGPQFVVKGTAGGLLEGFIKATKKSVTESKFKSGDKVTVKYPTLTKPLNGVVSTVLKGPDGDIVVLKGNNGVWDVKHVTLNEGNAFGAAVTKAKEEGKKEFEFNGKTYKVKKGSYEKKKKEEGKK
jgi:hypothetical protein